MDSPFTVLSQDLLSRVVTQMAMGLAAILFMDQLLATSLMQVLQATKPGIWKALLLWPIAAQIPMAHNSLSCLPIIQVFQKPILFLGKLPKAWMLSKK